MKSIFPHSIDGDLLRLVHLSNGFRMVPEATPLRVGDVCKAEARVFSVVNAPEGKTVKVKGHVYRGDEPVIEVTSAFLYRGRFSDSENTFETTEEPDYAMTIQNDVDVGVMESKNWWTWNRKHVLAQNANLVFRVQSKISHPTRAAYSNIHVTGDIFIRGKMKNLVKVGAVEYQSDAALGNPVVAYLQRHATPLGVTVNLPSEYTLTTTDIDTKFNAPLTNEAYSKISGDFNPIHINPYFSDYASLPATITHGLWSSAATRRYVELIAAQGKPERVLSYVTFEY